MIASRTALLFTALVATLGIGVAAAQTVQYTDPGGRVFRSEPDTGAVARAQRALADDPTSVDRLLALGLAQAGVRQYREAIESFTRGLELAPDNAMLLRWRGHRYLSVRELDRALADLTRGSRIDPSIYGVWYHLGIVHFARGEFDLAASDFRKAQPLAPDAGELAGSTDWLWMSLSRAGRTSEAREMLDRRPDSLPIDNAYARRLRLYRGEIAPDEVLTDRDTDGVNVATLSYGLGNWYVVRGDFVEARSWFERSVSTDGWPAFGFIVSEIELRRLGAR